MLRINILSNGPAAINFFSFKNYQLPVPAAGLERGDSNDAVLLFDDEEQASAYSDQLKELSESFHDASSKLRKARNEVIEAIDNEERVKDYIIETHYNAVA